MPIPLLIGSNNRHKLDEYAELLSDTDFEVISPRRLGLDLDVDETGTTFARNAILKATAFSHASGLLSLADDSGLQVDALGGDPGVYSARYGGVGLSDEDRVALVLHRLADVPPAARTARFVACIALAMPEGGINLAEASVEGQIAPRPRGEGGFGYDPIFVYPSSDKTFAQMAPAEKNAVSHRSRAAALAWEILQALRTGDILR